MAKFRCEVVGCLEENGDCKAAAIFVVDGSTIWIWQKHKAAINECEASHKEFTGPRK
jgi:hypothetical protein